MNIFIRILIVLVTAAIVLAAEYYSVQILELDRGAWKYCLIVGFGGAIIIQAWRATAPKKPTPPQSN